MSSRKNAASPTISGQGGIRRCQARLRIKRRSAGSASGGWSRAAPFDTVIGAPLLPGGAAARRAQYRGSAKAAIGAPLLPGGAAARRAQYRGSAEAAIGDRHADKGED